MAGNSYGQNFRITTFGESHGNAVGVVVDGCPAGIHLCEKDIQQHLDKRRPSGQPFETTRNEQDVIEIVSGVFDGKTVGTPITMLVRNQNHRSNDYDHLKNIFRTGHADLTYHLKYHHRDHRGGGRASARETIGRVAGGAIARKILAQNGVNILGYVVAIGDISAKFNHELGAYHIDTEFINNTKNIIHAPQPDIYDAMIEKLDQACSPNDGSGVGGKVEIRITGLQGGVGEPVFRKLNAELAAAVMSIPAVTGIEFGLGFKFATMTGNQISNLIGKKHNNSTPPNIYGGIQGGISNGNNIVLRYSIKAPSSKLKTYATLGSTETNENTNTKIGGRHDSFIGSRSIIIAESMVALCILDLLIEHRQAGCDPALAVASRRKR